MFVTVVGVERSLRAARVATYAYFVLDGTLLGTWMVHIRPWPWPRWERWAS